MLREAAKGGHIPVLDLLITNYKADINGHSSSYGNTPLHKAVLKHQANACEWLLKNGADPKIKNVYFRNDYTLHPE